MRVEVTLDDDLVAKARQLSEIDDLSALLNEALRALVRREEARSHRSPPPE